MTNWLSLIFMVSLIFGGSITGSFDFLLEAKEPAESTKNSNHVTGTFTVAKQTSEIHHVYAFIQKCEMDNLDPVGPDVMLLFSDVEIAPEFLVDEFMDQIIAFNHGELLNLANGNKIHAFTVSIGPRPKGMSDTRPAILLHERAQLYHSAFGQNANVSQGSDGTFEGTLNGKQFSGTIKQKGNFARPGTEYEYQVTFSGVAKDLPNKGAKQ